MLAMQLDLWQGEVDALPWGGRRPRELAKEIVSERLRSRTCGVDNFLVRCPSASGPPRITDSAQLMLCISTSFKKEV